MSSLLDGRNATEELHAQQDEILREIFRQVEGSIAAHGTVDIDQDIIVAMLDSDDEIGIGVVPSSSIMAAEAKSPHAGEQALFHIGEAAMLRGHMPITVYLVAISSGFKRLDKNPGLSSVEEFKEEQAVMVVGLSFEHRFAYIIQGYAGYGPTAHLVGERKSITFSEGGAPDGFKACVKRENGEIVQIDMAYVFMGAYNGTLIQDGEEGGCS